MENQLSFADCEYRQSAPNPERKVFVPMEALVPWHRIEAVIEPYYPKRVTVGDLTHYIFRQK
ncbi:hypothetical protein [Amphritea balenae]|uniref:IS5/IS1182 family transposase n=1 Tax=Amphritea balenae TaxID=452629 RepID=A0A3P1SQT4_9GAMM|nr:hypothetical protein [Amphritea balenae]RRC99601.1 hypothetical protein EHS89_08840 [Amphritea balenae]GGK78340.1 hypothetical protein GCM10007941_30630 [Amphritea balenae]